ncbi:MAG: peptide chain release factor 2 [Candidatus Omnitrophica bacterium]|nr:peptide chain release factor 2 [Candidatus Omnitrophota bacterium]MBU4302839.1 peptide chain release factor 2 [Candidatus Omnitrophota bacterium]MBU4418555.1 peptide chain release factor 2 [Candidatus Omnitrophota bacterium]MBU4468714.1 peptide chain release factor 2 [Candidatus Omnitrophota bacterium]MCG2707734.1 peptide chain release factor 2 [Candidatus Omnitrophota bacterium]
MIEDIKSELNGIGVRLENLRVIFDVALKRQKIDALNEQMSSEGFWNNTERSTSIVKELKNLKTTVEPWELAYKKYQELAELIPLLKENDQDLVSELTRNAAILIGIIDKLEFQVLLGGVADKNSAILSINAGAGGTESCDWAGMLLRMYSRFAESHDYSVKIIDILSGEEAGIKNVTLLIEGPYAFGYLKAERGVHRLVRISPFDANKRRHTSFASVDVIPEIEEELDLKIQESDLRVDVFRAKGAGGQSVNTTDSAVRITHLPSGIVAQCQNERSQFQNKQTALKILKARIYEAEQAKKAEEVKQQDSDKKRIEWGSQIRSYVLHPYNLVKDHRTDFETADSQKILDGGLDDFIEAFLKFSANK